MFFTIFHLGLWEFDANKIKDLFSGKQSDLISEGTRTSLLDSVLNNNKKVNPQFQKAQDPFGAYKDNIIYLFERADTSTFMHEIAHWFKKELKKFGSEKSAMMLKKVEEWEPNL